MFYRQKWVYTLNMNFYFLWPFKDNYCNIIQGYQLSYWVLKQWCPIRHMKLLVVNTKNLKSSVSCAPVFCFAFVVCLCFCNPTQKRTQYFCISLLGSHKKVSQTGWVKQSNFISVLQAARPRSRCLQLWFLLRPLSGLQMTAFSCVLISPHHLFKGPLSKYTVMFWSIEGRTSTYGFWGDTSEPVTTSYTVTLCKAHSLNSGTSGFISRPCPF